MVWYIARHGQTLENKKEIQQGHYPSLLTIQGINQAKSIGYRLLDQEEDFSKFKFVSSPLVRTRHTLQIIMEVLGITNNQEAVDEELLIGTKKGIFENMNKKDIETLYPEEYQKKLNDSWNYIPLGGGESKESSYNRLLSFIEKYKNEENLVIVSHRSLVKMLNGILLKLDKEEIKKLSKDTTKSQNYFYRFKDGKIDKI